MNYKITIEMIIDSLNYPNDENKDLNWALELTKDIMRSEADWPGPTIKITARNDKNEMKETIIDNII